MNTERITEHNPVNLASIGDAVFAWCAREFVLNSAEYKSHELNVKVNSLVKAQSQSQMLENVLNILTEQEKDVVRRGRNCHTPAKAKNAGLMDYKRATALEALIGWLYLGGQTERLNEIMLACVNSVK